MSFAESHVQTYGIAFMTKPQASRLSGRRLCEALVLGRVELRFDRPDDASGDLVLQDEEIGKLDVVALGPGLPARRGVGELRADAKALSGAPHAPVQHIAHAQRPSDLPDVERLAAKGERRIARRDEQPAQPSTDA